MGFSSNLATAYRPQVSETIPRSYAQAEAIYQAWEHKRGRRSEECKLLPNTVLEFDTTGDGSTYFAVRLHRTRIVTFYADGRIVLNTGGWQTLTTRDRMQRCGIRIGMQGGVAQLSHGKRTVAYLDGMILHPKGRIERADGKRARNAEDVRGVRRRALAAYRRYLAGKTGAATVPWFWQTRSGGYVPCGNCPEAD